VARADVAVALGFGLVALAFAYPARSGFLGRRRGLLLLVLYAVYLAALIQGQT
jgi:cation:H+ antiporter